MKKYVFILAMAFLATQFQSCSSGDEDSASPATQYQSSSGSEQNAVQLIEPNEESPKSIASAQLPSSGNVEPTEGPTFYFEYAWADPVEIQVPKEGKATFTTYHYGDFEVVRRVFPKNASWITGMFSVDYMDTNRYRGPDWREYYLSIPPNKTSNARQDTVKFLFAANSDVPNEDRYCVPVVIKQAAGPCHSTDLKNHILGQWHHHIIATNAVNGKPFTECNYDVVFNDDGSYREDKHEVGIDRDYNYNGWEKGTYEITKVELDDSNCLRVYLKMTYTYGPTTADEGYSSGYRETYFVIYPHFMLWTTGRSRYYDRVSE